MRSLLHSVKQLDWLPTWYTKKSYLRFKTAVTSSISGFDDDTSKIYVKFRCNEAPSANYATVFMVRQANTYNSWRIISLEKQENAFYVYGNSKSPASATGITQWEIHEAVCEDGKVTIDGTTYNTTNQSPATPSDKTLVYWAATRQQDYFYLRVERQGQIIYDLVPAVRNSDNAAGFYNRVSDSFFTITGATAW